MRKRVLHRRLHMGCGEGLMSRVSVGPRTDGASQDRLVMRLVQAKVDKDRQ